MRLARLPCVWQTPSGINEVGENAMKAAVFREANTLMDIEDVQHAKPGPREVLLKTSAAGVCHSDLHFYNGTYPGVGPMILGHESAGIVDLMAIRKDHGTHNSKFKRGDLFEIILIQIKGGGARLPDRTRRSPPRSIRWPCFAST